MIASEPPPLLPAGAPAPSDGTRSGPSGAAAGETAGAGVSARTPPPARGSGPALREVDPITLEVVCEGLIAIVREMRATIIRSSFSSVIYEFDDFSCALFGSGGEMVAQSWDHPGHVLPLPWGVRCMFEDFADDLHPGDVVLLNDPYRGGTHLNDVTMVHPIFDEDGNILVFPAVRAHWVDVGGMVPGSYSGLSTNIYQEGVRIPPIKILEGGSSTVPRWPCSWPTCGSRRSARATSTPRSARAGPPSGGSAGSTNATGPIPSTPQSASTSTAPSAGSGSGSRSSRTGAVATRTTSNTTRRAGSTRCSCGSS